MTSKHLLLGGVTAATITQIILSVFPNSLTSTQWASIVTLAFAAGSAVVHRVEAKGLKRFFSGLWNGPTPPAV